MLFLTNVHSISFNPKKGSFFALCSLPSARLDHEAFIAQRKKKVKKKKKKNIKKAIYFQKPKLLKPGLSSCKARAMEISS